MALALSISEMGEKSSQIGTQTQLEIAGLEVIQYRTNTMETYSSLKSFIDNRIFLLYKICCDPMSIQYFDMAVDTASSETIHFVFPTVYISLGWEQQRGPNFGGRGWDWPCH